MSNHPSSSSSSSRAAAAKAKAAHLLGILEAKARETFGDAELPTAIADKRDELRARAGVSGTLSATVCANIDALARSRRWDLEHGMAASAEATAKLMHEIAGGFKHHSTSPEDARWNAGLRQTIDHLAAELGTTTA